MRRTSRKMIRRYNASMEVYHSLTQAYSETFPYKKQKEFKTHTLELIEEFRTWMYHCKEHLHDLPIDTNLDTGSSSYIYKLALKALEDYHRDIKTYKYEQDKANAKMFYKHAKTLITNEYKALG